MAHPPRLALLGKLVEAPGHIGSRCLGLLRLGQDRLVESARDRHLLDDGAIVAAVDSVQYMDDGTGVLDERGKVGAGALFAVGDAEHRVLYSGRDEVILER